MSGIKSQDIVVLFKLVGLQDLEDETRLRGTGPILRDDLAYSVRNLESILGISKTEINSSFKRIISTGMASKDRETGRPKPNRRNLYGFIVHGLKFVFPAEPGALTRGIPTAFAAPMLKSLLFTGGEHIYVWPSAAGLDLGQSVLPLFRSVPEAANKDESLYEYLALVDAIRLGKQREAGFAKDRLHEKLILK